MHISKNVIDEMVASFQNSPFEQGFLLGSSKDLLQIDYCCHLPALNASVHYYEPNYELADSTIHSWHDNGVCFSGFVHSHICPKPDLSENDVDFAKTLFSSFNLPFLWFGIGFLSDSIVSFRFFSVSKFNNEIKIQAIPFSIIE